MPLRLIEMVIPEGRQKELDAILQDQPIVGAWNHSLPEDQTLVKVLLQAEKAEAVLDILEKRFSMLQGFRVVILPVEASLPRPKPEEKPVEQKPAEEKPPFGRMYREEVYSDIVDEIKTSRTCILLSALSSIVAAIGIYRANPPVIIGAMVIAPLLGPNVALSFATTLADTPLARRALKASAAGILSALVPAIILGMLLSSTIVPEMEEIEPRTRVGVWDVAIALVAGVVGALAFTTGIPTALVGVMVAVALLPPLATFGLLLGSSHFDAATGSLSLLVTNLICVNLAGVVTFLAQGIQPKTWWEAAKAKEATRKAVFFWAILLLTLVIVMILPRGPRL